jgi:hypothetical protein
MRVYLYPPPPPLYIAYFISILYHITALYGHLAAKISISIPKTESFTVYSPDWGIESPGFRVKPQGSTVKSQVSATEALVSAIKSQAFTIKPQASLKKISSKEKINERLRSCQRCTL